MSKDFPGVMPVAHVIWDDYLAVLADRDAARRELAEAAECVRLLLAWGRARYRDDLCSSDAETYRNVKAAYRALPAWMRKEIER